MYNILTIDGGGIRGLIALQQLVEFERLLGRPIHEAFDLISGTSTGGIIAVMLALGHTAKDLLTVYTIHGEKIFDKEFLRWGWLRPKYDDAYFNCLLRKYVGDKRLKDLKVDVLIPGYDATAKDKILFKSRKAKVMPDYDFPLFDVVRCTMSAQTFFKPYQMGEEQHYYIDGGMVINNPSMISWVETLDYDHDTINVISFSTGITEKPISDKIARGGKLGWAEPTLDILLAEQSQTTDYHMNKLFIREPGSYARCESHVIKSSGKIDDTSKDNISNMLDDGEFSAGINRETMLQFIAEITK